MKAFYSLIKIALNEMSGDSLTIGLILSTASGFKIKFSNAKKNFSKSLLPVDNSIIDFLEKEITSKIEEQNLLLSNNNPSFFELPSLLSSEYFSYLSNYSNGLLKFTSPSFIADNINDEKFHKLFSLLVDSSGIENEKKDNSIREFEKQFYRNVNVNLLSKVIDKVHVNETLNNRIVPSLFNTFQIDCIGLNGVFIGAKSLPFTQSKETLHKSLNTYVSVIAHLSSTYNKSLKDNNFFLIADEPDKNSPVYNFWKELYQHDKLLKVISSTESGQVAEIIEETKATKFF